MAGERIIAAAVVAGTAIAGPDAPKPGENPHPSSEIVFVRHQQSDSALILRANEVRGHEQFRHYQDLLDTYTNVGTEVQAVVAQLSEEQFAQQFIQEYVPPTGFRSELTIPGLGQDEVPLDDLRPTITFSEFAETGLDDSLTYVRQIKAYPADKERPEDSGLTTRRRDDVYIPLSDEELIQPAEDFVMFPTTGDPTQWARREMLSIDPASDAEGLVRRTAINGNPVTVKIDRSGAMILEFEEKVH